MAAVTGTYDCIVSAGAVSVSFSSIAGSATAYVVRGIDGSSVASGAVSGTTVTITPAGGWPAGFSLVEFTVGSWSGSTGFVVDSVQVLGLRSVGTFPPLPANGTTPAASDPNNRGLDVYMHSVLLMGPQRPQIHDAANPTVYTAGTDEGGTIANIQANIALMNTTAGYTNPTYADADRPRPLFVQFPSTAYTASGYSAGVTATVAALGPSTQYNVKYFEGLNEPSQTPSGNLTAAQSAAQFSAFAPAVRAGDAAAVPIGPGEVSICPTGADAALNPDCGYLRSWLADLTQPLGGFSVHAYNGYNGDMVAFKGWWAAWVAELTLAGYANVPRFLTENSVGGDGTRSIFSPNQLLAWQTVLYLVSDRYGCPKEHIYWFFDRDVGFQTYGLKETKGDLRVMAAFLRVLSEELSGKAYDTSVDFGTVGNNFYLGNIYRGAGGCTVALVAQGNPGDTITLAVTDGGPITYSTCTGVTGTLTVTGGHITVPVSHLPTYVRLTRNCTVTPVEAGSGVYTGTNIATAATATSGSSSAHISRVNDGVFQTGGYLAGPDYGFISGGDPEAQLLPDWVDLTWGSTKSVALVVIRQMAPWVDFGGFSAMTQGKLEYWTGSSWAPCPTTAANHWNDVGVYDNTTATTAAAVRLGLVGGKVRMTTGWDYQWNFNVPFRYPVQTTKIRWTVTKSSIGHLPNLDAAALNLIPIAGSQIPGQTLQCSEILVYEDSRTLAQVIAAAA